MTTRYRAGYKAKRRWRKLFAVLLISLVIFGAIFGFVMWDMSKNSESGEIEGESRSVAQQEDVKAATSQKKVNEPLFSLDLPMGWKETERANTENEQSITWQSKIKKQDNRWLKLYIDVIPPNLAVNKLLPLDVASNMISYRQISDNCKNFTTAKKKTSVAQPSKWQGVEFICDLPGFVQNKVGTGTAGSLNSTTVTGPQKGKHKYFFVYTDHNIQPDYQLFYGVLKSFQAK